MFDKDKLLNKLKNKHYSFNDLAREMNIPIFKNRDFSSFLFNLQKSNEIFIDRNNNYFVPIFFGIFNGNIIINSKGYGFVDINTEEAKFSVFISRNDFNSAFNGDNVEIKVYYEKTNPGKYFGSVNKILLRNTKFLVGWTIKDRNGFLSFKSFNEKYNSSNFRFENENNLEINKLIKVQIIEYFKHYTLVKIIKYLGDLNNSFDEINLVVEDSNIYQEFSSEVLNESKKIPNSINNEKEEIIKRKDYREKLIVTIDGDDTKDYDDAFYLEKQQDGNFILSIHIADVSYYVKENTKIDEEALKRGTSIYLVDRVIPMLPESLSNGICSLNPNVDRFTMCIEILIDKNGKTIKSEIFPSIINSKYRLTYSQVNHYYAKKISLKDENLEKMLDQSLELSNILQKYKELEGYVDFEIEESKIILDHKGKTSRIDIKSRGISEILIENFMIRANEEVAKFLSNKKIPTLYRVHEKPDSEKINKLNSVVKSLNLEANFKLNEDPIKFSKSLNILKNQRFDNFIKIMILRTMQKAKYTPKNIGHFGLGSKFYLHFTSPIRRYPDLETHRIIRDILFEKNSDKINYYNKILTKIGDQATQSEIKAVELERNVADIKKAEFYEDKVGKSFKGMIVNILSFGFFVEFDNKVDVLVHNDNLISDEFKLSDDGNKLIGKNNTYSVGDFVDVTIISANRLLKKIDAILTKDYNNWIKQNI